MFLKARSIVAVVLVLGCLAAPLAAAPADNRPVTVRMRVESATRLRVSSSVLTFEVSDPASPPTVPVEFSAGARTYQGGEVLLTVEPSGTLETPNGRPSQKVAIGYQGEGQAGTLAAGGPSTAGRWVGSGLREGRLLFTLRGAVAPGTYSLPVKFVLSTP